MSSKDPSKEVSLAGQMASDSGRKRVYSTPRLVSYGDVAKLTGGVSGTLADGPSNMQT